ncbi:ABC transporter ATP-binding protein [Alphaproteobacteria bacterium]|nr:ABC transporter ATP-binding protein [Alphaproteobacteria bacterium]
MTPIVSISNVSKTYDGGGEALKNVSLDIQEGEIIALLGPNGAGKTTLISAICGLTSLTSGSITVGGYDIIKDYRKTRSLIGLVPQEISIEPFQTVTHALTYSRGLFGRPSNAQYIENLLKKLSLWDKAKSKVMELSGGMKRRVLIGKALSHEPRVLFLDEPTAGVDVELRKDMWDVIAELKADGVTIILTTHYIEEAEAIADRIGVIAHGEILLVEGKAELIQRMGAKTMHVELQSPIKTIPAALNKYNLTLSDDGARLEYIYDTRAERTGITALLTDLNNAGLTLKDVQTSQSSLEDIFVDLVKE